MFWFRLDHDADSVLKEARGTGARARNEVTCAHWGIKAFTKEPRRHLIRTTDSGRQGQFHVGSLVLWRRYLARAANQLIQSWLVGPP